MKKDRIYSSPQNEIKKFAFDERVASVFSDMLDRSVPGYRDIVAMIGVLAEQYAQPESQLYDLGCSLGTVSMVLSAAVSSDGCKIIAVDNSKAMTARAKENLGKVQGSSEVKVICDDIQNVAIEKASVVILNFTLQFVDLEKRCQLLKNIYEGMLPGGVLVVSEKIAFEESDEQGFQTDLHHAFKKMHGYSDLEISQKRTALEDVLVPEKKEDHLNRFEEAGFSKRHLWFQCFNFASFLAIK